MARPVRIGLVFEPSAEMLRLAVEQATSLWGGQYQPFFRPGDLDRIERVSRRLGVDVLLALDRAVTSEEAAALDGYQWRGRAGGGRWRLARITSTTVWVPIIHPCWSGRMSILVEGTAEPVPSADIEVRDPLRIGNRFG